MVAGSNPALVGDLQWQEADPNFHWQAGRSPPPQLTGCYISTRLPAAGVR